MATSTVETPVDFTTAASAVACRADGSPLDPFVSRARPAFLYVVYTMILTSLPVGAIAAFRPDIAAAIAGGVRAYLSAFPEPLYALFGAGYLGCTAARQWGKAVGSDT